MVVETSEEGRIMVGIIVAVVGLCDLPQGRLVGEKERGFGPRVYPDFLAHPGIVLLGMGDDWIWI
jgi:hypothetical protein